MKKLWNKLKRTGKKAVDKLDGRADAEISAEEVVETEIYPSGKCGRSASARAENSRAVKRSCGNKRTACRGKLDKTGTDAVKNAKADAADKPASKRTRPTNPEYKMIDPDGNSADAGKS